MHVLIAVLRFVIAFLPGAFLPGAVENRCDQRLVPAADRLAQLLERKQIGSQDRAHVPLRKRRIGSAS
jgi:hypothetical protein